MPAEVSAQRFAQTMQWFTDTHGKVTPGFQFQPPPTATTVRHQGNGQTVVTDGPFLEGNEVIGGYAVADVADLDEALRLAKTWPMGGIVEIRPVVAR